MRAKLPGIDDTLGYSVYLCAGTISWQFFVEVLNRTQTVFVDNGGLLKKVSFPKISLPIYIILSSLINYLLLMVIFLIFLFFTKREPDLSLLGILPIILIQQIFASGLGIFLATLNVFYRDISHFMSIIIQFWFWLTPIVYPIQIIPPNFKWLIDINPLAKLIKSQQDIFLYGFWPIWDNLKAPLIVSLIFAFLGYFIFKKLGKEIVDEL